MTALCVLLWKCHVIPRFVRADQQCNPAARKKATYDKFGEEGLKGGIPPESVASGAWSSGYAYHENPEKTFRQFFGGDNPFAGKIFKIRFYIRPVQAQFLPQWHFW